MACLQGRAETTTWSRDLASRLNISMNAYNIIQLCVANFYVKFNNYLVKLVILYILIYSRLCCRYMYKPASNHIKLASCAVNVMMGA